MRGRTCAEVCERIKALKDDAPEAPQLKAAVAAFEARFDHLATKEVASYDLAAVEGANFGKRRQPRCMAKIEGDLVFVKPKAPKGTPAEEKYLFQRKLKRF